MPTFGPDVDGDCDIGSATFIIAAVLIIDSPVDVRQVVRFGRWCSFEVVPAERFDSDSCNFLGYGVGVVVDKHSNNINTVILETVYKQRTEKIKPLPYHKY